MSNNTSKTVNSKWDSRIAQEEFNFAFYSSGIGLSEWIDTCDVTEGDNNMLPYLPEIRNAA